MANPLVRGGDYSRFQKVIDWTALPADRAFAYLGMWDWQNLVVDTQLARNVAEADKNGRVVGGYYRVDPTRWTAAQEAARMVELLERWLLDEPGRLIPAVDIERTGKSADAQVNWPRWTRDFFAAWENLTDLPLVVYSSGSWFADLLGGTADWPAWVKVWVGHTEKYSGGVPAEEWAGKTKYELPRAVVHQYSHNGRLSGIAGDVDLDCLMPGVTLADITLKDSGNHMPQNWLPGYRQHLFPLRGKPYQYTHNPKVCIHTTEGSSISGALAAYAPYPPHLIYDPRTREKVQHVPLNLASYSAMDGNDDDYIIQVEIVGFATHSRDWSEQILRNIAEDVFLPLEENFGVPRVAIWHGFKDGRDGISPPLATTGSPIRITPAQLRDFSGYLGHQHLCTPDTHWDPGHLPIDRIFGYMKDGFLMALSDQEQTNLASAVDAIYKALFVTASAPNAPGREKETFHDIVANTAAETQAVVAAGVPVKVELSDEDLDKVVAKVLEAVGDVVFEKAVAANKSFHYNNVQVTTPKPPPTGG